MPPEIQAEEGNDKQMRLETEITPTKMEQNIPCRNPMECATINSAGQGPSTSKNQGDVIPSPFKRILFWPENSKTVKKRIKEKTPAVVTSPLMLQYLEKKAAKKNLKKLKRKENGEKENRERKTKH